MPDRALPWSREVEQALIGAVLIKPSIWSWVDLEVDPDDFFLPSHREIWGAIHAVGTRDAPIDVITIIDELKINGMLARLEGGEGYLLACANALPTAENAAHYVSVLKNKSTLRKLIAVSLEAASSAYGDFHDVNVLVEDVATKISALSGGGTGLTSFRDLIDPVLERIEQRILMQKEGKAVVTGISFGIAKLNEITTGLQPEDLCIIAADTGGGKTALAMQVAILNVLGDGTSIAFNLEMPNLQLVERAIVHLAQLNSHLVRTGQLDGVDLSCLHGAAAKLFESPFYIEDRTFSIAQIIAKMRRWRAKHPKKRGLAVVDFAQLIRSMGGKDTRSRELGIVAQTLKRAAKELKMAIILVSQLSREGVKPGKRPSLHDLKESGDLEQAADLILLPHNADETEDGDMDIYIDKQRNGPRRKVRARWIGRHYMFTDPEIDTGTNRPPERRYVE